MIFLVLAAFGIIGGIACVETHPWLALASMFAGGFHFAAFRASLWVASHRVER
mgnify:CR=1 FL=1